MKAVAAAILNQPNRSARDYRGITAEYQDKLFLDDHDVRLYYASCYLYYKLDYLWRNQKIDSAHKIYRFYIMAAIGKKIIAAGNVFSQKKQDIESAASKIIALCDNEQKLKSAVEKTAAMLNRRVSMLDASTREKLRDTIRSESFAKFFDTDLSAEKILD